MCAFKGSRGGMEMMTFRLRPGLLFLKRSRLLAGVKRGLPLKDADDHEVVPPRLWENSAIKFSSSYCYFNCLVISTFASVALFFYC